MKKFLIVIASAILGGICGYLGIGYIDQMISELSDFNAVIILAGVLFCLIVSILFHVVLHEAGHLLCGKISGYDFVSFRIFSLMFIKENGKLTRKKFRIAGTGGQCLMSPPEPVNGEFPYILYNLGGPLINLILSSLCYVLNLSLSKTHPLYAALFAIFALMGLLLGLTNLIPLKTDGIANDGFNALTLGRRKKARHAFWLQLRVNALLTNGARVRDLPADWFVLPDDDDLDDVMVIAAAILRFHYLMDRREFEEAKILAEHLLDTAVKMLELHKNELRCELLFLEIVGECRQEVINRLYDKQLKKYIKATKSYISRQRLIYAYAKLVAFDDRAAEKAYQKFVKACTTYPNAGEIVSERELIDLINHKAG